jgi:hypothetical protein
MEYYPSIRLGQMETKLWLAIIVRIIIFKLVIILNKSERDYQI